MKGNHVFTTGQVAKICHVAPRTVTKWFDEGRIKGYRVPGSQDRRITRDALARFLKDNGFPTEALEEAITPVVLALALDDTFALRLQAELGSACELRQAHSAYHAGVLSAVHRPTALAIDFALGRTEALSVARAFRSLPQHNLALLVLLASEDEADLEALVCWQRCLAYRQPCDPALLAGAILEHLED